MFEKGGQSQEIVMEPLTMKLEVCVSDVRQLEGKMLTIVEAALSDPEQRKAVKDIVRQEIWDWANSKYPTATAGGTYTITSSNGSTV